MTVGTVGIHYFEGPPYINAFYFMSMLATAQGPPSAPATVAGKIFASIMAFISVGSIVAALGFLFGPFFGFVMRLEGERMEKEIQVHMLKTESHEKS
jgi:H+/gluconate symporter-like permease